MCGIAVKPVAFTVTMGVTEDYLLKMKAHIMAYVLMTTIMSGSAVTICCINMMEQRLLHTKCPQMGMCMTYCLMEMPSG